jgi:hypothetical protein
MKNFNGRPFFSLFFIARANQKIPNLALGLQSKTQSQSIKKGWYRHQTPENFKPVKNLHCVVSHVTLPPTPAASAVGK